MLTVQNQAFPIQNAGEWDCLPKWHQYSFAIIGLFVRLVLSGPTSLRGASHALELVLSLLFGAGFATPCANAGRLWVLRLGLYELTRPKEKADDWAWIMDHTIQIGSTKFLVILGCRLRAWRANRKPLEHHDLTVLALEPVQQSNGEVVCEQLTRMIEVTGIPCSIVADGGTDLNRGINLFRQQHPQVIHSHDIVHKTASFLKKILTADPRWHAFLKNMASSKKQFTHTALAFLAPPMVPDQARYMNLEGLLKWATRLRQFMDDPKANDGSLAEPEQVRLRCAWLRDFDKSLADWQKLMEVVETTLSFIRWRGYHRNAHLELHARLIPHAGSPSVDLFIEQVVNFVAEQSLAVKIDEPIVGSSECIESLIGKGKRLEGQQSRSGFTAMVLGMAAAVVKPTQETIATAFAAINGKHVTEWVKRNLGPSVQACRRIAFHAADNGTKTG